jgi:hypothetical protein
MRGKRASPVLRGAGRSNAPGLPGIRSGQPELKDFGQHRPVEPKVPLAGLWTVDKIRPDLVCADVPKLRSH